MPAGCNANKPMGVARDGGRLAVGCGIDIWEFHNVPAVCAKLDESDDYPSTTAKHDACFLPRRSHCTGDIQIHEMAFVNLDQNSASNELLFVNTAFSCLATRSEENSFEPFWRPKWIKQIAPGDNCHLNGLAARAGQAKYVTALGMTNEPGGWRKNKRDDNGTAPDLRPASGSPLTINNSLIGSTDLPIGGTGNLIGSLATPIDPRLGPLADNGGPTQTHALLPDSPAIDAGDNSLAVDADGNPLSTDQRGTGFDRIFGGTVDIGAFEFESSALLVGDVNQDGVIGFDDIPSFISLLISGDFQDEADINGDGVVNFADIPFFIELLIALATSEN